MEMSQADSRQRHTARKLSRPFGQLVTQTRGDKPENARSGSPAAQPHFTDQIVSILMILGATQVIQILWYIYAQTYVWYRSTESRPAEITAGAATASGSPAASPFGSSTAGAARETATFNKDIVVHLTGCPGTANSTDTYEIRMCNPCIARRKKRAKNGQVSTCTSVLLTPAAQPDDAEI